MKNSKIKLIFLDIDGVIATYKTRFQLTPKKQDLLGFILNETDAKIVLSSSWRHHNVEDTVKHMNEEGFRFSDKIIGVTVRGYHQLEKGATIKIPRGVEISEWLDRNIIYPWYANPACSKEFEIYDENGNFKKMKSRRPGVDYEYVILDDDSDMLYYQRKYFIKTHCYNGLSFFDTYKAIKILNKRYSFVTFLIRFTYNKLKKQI